MSLKPTPSLIPALTALGLALMTAWLVRGEGWSPWLAAAVLGGGTLALAGIGVATLLLLAPREKRTNLACWILAVIKSDLAPLAEAWRMIRMNVK